MTKILIDILSLQGVPGKPNELSVSCFSDLGAWHGYALPDSAQSSLYGGFSGPFLIVKNKWLSRCLAKLTLYDMENKRAIDLSDCENSEFAKSKGFVERNSKSISKINFISFKKNG